MSYETFIGIIDSTLREGEQVANVHFTDSHKHKIIELLVALGVEEIELGIASSSSIELPALVHNAKDLAQGRSRVSLWCRCIGDDIQFAAACKPDILSLSIPVSDIHILSKLRRTKKWVLDTLQASIDKAMQAGIPFVSIGFEDATRADPDFLLQASVTAEQAGASRIRLPDTVGIASPGTLTNLVQTITRFISVPVGVHTHNDFGMASANGIAALEAGAKWIDATVLGLGERAGNCRLEEIIGYLSLQRGVARYKPERLIELCQTVSEAAGIDISPHHPIVGEGIFTCESGLHVHGLMEDPKTYEPYSPLRLGHERKLLFGSKTGRRAVQHKLLSLGLFITDGQADDLVQEIRILTRTTKPLVDEDLVRLAVQRIS